MTDFNEIKELCDAFGPSGFEEEVCQVVQKYMPSFHITKDAMNNLYIHHEGNRDGKPTLQLDAHLDEVGFIIQSIHVDGTLGLAPLGGWVLSSLPAQVLRIKTETGRMIPAIVVTKPPHFKNSHENLMEVTDMQDLRLDVGATSRQEVLDVFGIQVGDPVAPDVSCRLNEENGILFGKAFDNRLGCICIMEVMKRLAGKDLPVNLIGAMAAQEEVGMRGATVTSQQIKPDVAIVFEGSPADDLYFNEVDRQGALKNGTQIRYFDASYISHRPFLAFAQEKAKEYNLKTQRAVRRGGSTNAGKISLTGQAVPVLVLGVPSRFVHTHHNYAALEDLETTIELACHVIEHFKSEEILNEK